MQTGSFLRLVLPAVLFSLLYFMACNVEDSADVNQDKVYADYELFYNSNSDKTWVVARFRFGGATGTLLELKDPAEVTFNGEVLPYNVLFGGHFKEYAGQLTGGTFRYINVDGDVLENEVPAFEAIAFPAGLDEISKSSAYSLVWDGTPLAPNQRVALFVGSWTWGQDALFFQDGDGATDLVLGVNQLANLPTGPSTLFMDRSTDVLVTEGTSEGGRIRGKYRAENVEVTIVE